MARFRLHSSGRRVYLFGDTVIGRSTRCTCRLSEPHISAQHAAMAWTGRLWQLRDLGSRNGTFVDGQRLASGERVNLKRDCHVNWGGVSEDWIFEDAGEPCLVAEDLATGEFVEGTIAHLALPSAEEPLVWIRRADGASWTLHTALGEKSAENGQIICVGERGFRLRLPEALIEEPAQTVEDFNDVALHFLVSRDEEHVELVIETLGQRHRFPARAYNYVLLTLARARLRDSRNPELPATSHGWLDVDVLSQMLSVDKNYINVNVHRCREQLARCGIQAGKIIERRPSVSQLRVAASQIEIRCE